MKSLEPLSSVTLNNPLNKINESLSIGMTAYCNAIGDSLVIIIAHSIQ